MKAKEFLKERGIEDNGVNSVLMEQYAKEKAVEFVEWTYISCYEPIDVDKWKRLYTDEAIIDAENSDINLDNKVYITSELFEKYKNDPLYDQFINQHNEG